MGDSTLAINLTMSFNQKVSSFAWNGTKMMVDCQLPLVFCKKNCSFQAQYREGEALVYYMCEM